MLSCWDHFLVIFWSFLGSFFHFLVTNRFNRLKNDCIRSYKASWGLIRPYKVTLWTHLGLSWAVFGAILRNLIQSWAILGSFWDRFWSILNNFATILGTSSNLVKKSSQTFRSERWFSLPFEGRPLRNARFQFGQKKAFFIFEPLKTHFWHPIWNPILAADLPKKQQDEPKRTIRSFKDQKTAFSKPLKNHQFFNIFGSRDLPREPQEAQEGSQEAPKELQNLKKN